MSRCDGCGRFASPRQLVNLLLCGFVRRLHIGCGYFDSNRYATYAPTDTGARNG